MAWSRVGQSTSSAVASGNVSVTEPAGVASGDLMIAAVSYRGTAAFTPPSGWTVIAHETSGNADAVTPDPIASLIVCLCVRGGSAPGLTFTRTGGNVALAGVTVYRSDAGGTIGLDTYSQNTLGAASVTATTGSLTTSASNQLIVAIGGWARGGVANTATLDAATDPATDSSGTDTTNNPSAGTWRARVRVTTNTGADTGLVMGDALRSSPGATGTISIATSANAGRHAMIAATFLESSSPPPAPAAITFTQAFIVG